MLSSDRRRFGKPRYFPIYSLGFRLYIRNRAVESHGHCRSPTPRSTSCSSHSK